MKLKDLVKITEPNTAICLYSATTKSHLGRFESSDNTIMKYDNCEVVSLSTWCCNNRIDVDIEIGVLAELEPHELDVVNLWEKIFGSSNNHWFYDVYSYKWAVDGIDTPNGGYRFDTKKEMLETMAIDIKEVLFCEALGGTIADFVSNNDL